MPPAKKKRKRKVSYITSYTQLLCNLDTMTAILQAYIAKPNMDFFPISVNRTPFFFFCVLFHTHLPC